MKKTLFLIPFLFLALIAAAQDFQTENQSIMQEMQSLMADAKMKDLITERNFAVSMDYPTAILDSIGADRDMKDFFVGLNAA